MANTLTVFFRSITAYEVEFILSDGNEAPPVDRDRCRIEALADRVAELGPITTTVVIPGEWVTSRSVNIPPGSRKQLERALPYLLEDDLACSPEVIHAAPTSPATSDEAVVLVIGKILLQSVLDHFAQSGLHCDRLIPDYLLLPSGDRPRMVHEQDRIIIRFPDGTGMALPTQVLASLPDDEWETLDGKRVFVATSAIPEAYNLLQGAYRQKNTRHPSRQLKTLFLVLALVAFVHIVYFIAAGWYFQQQGDRATLQAEQDYRALFPDEQRVVNIRRQLEGRLHVANPTSGTDSFLDLLGGLANATTADPSAIAKIKHLNFDLQQGHLLAELEVNTLPDLQRFNALLTDQGIATQVLGASKNQEGLSARVTIKRTGQP